MKTHISFPKNLVLIISFFTAFIISSCGDDNNNNPIVVTPDEIVVTPSTLAFQMVRTDDMKKMNISIKNESNSKVSIDLSVDGTDKDYFKLAGDSKREIGANETITVEVTFTPLEARGYTAKIFVKYDGKIVKNGEVSLSGSGTVTAKLNVSPNPVNFGMAKPGVSRVMNIIIENISTSTLDLALEIIDDNDGVFQIDGSNNITIPVDKLHSVAIRFTPKSEKGYTAFLKIDKDNQVELKGEGSNQINLNFSPAALSFSEVIVGKTSIKKVTIQNLALTEVTLVPEITGNDAAFFKVINYTKTPIEAGSTGEIEVEFKPTLGKIYNAQLYVEDDKLAFIPLSGIGIIKDDIEINPLSLDFGSIDVSTSSELSISIKNLFSQAITLNNSLSGTGLASYTISKDLTNLNTNQTGELKIKFTPTEAKDYQAQVNIITSNSVEYTVTLKGRGKTVESLTLVSSKVANGPVIDGKASDASWNQATALNLSLVQVEPSKPGGTMTAKIRSVNDGTHIYFLIEVDDATQDDIPNKFEFKGGDPADDANWTLNINGQDGLGLIFPISSVVSGDDSKNTFDLVGCRVACHTAMQSTKYESGMFPTKGRIDVWYWKAGTTNQQGKADDYYAVGSDGPADEKSIRQGDFAGRTFSDPNFPAPGAGKILPISVPGSNNNGFDKSKFIWDSDADAFDPLRPNPATGTAWKSGDIVPGWKIREQNNSFSGRGDIDAKGSYSAGKWTIEIKRAFNTQSENNDDAVLKAGTKHPFSIAYFNNSRKLSTFEYIDTWKNPNKPAHYGSNPSVIVLDIK